MASKKKTTPRTWDLGLKGTALGDKLEGLTHEQLRHLSVPPVVKLMVMDFAAGHESVPVGGEGRDRYYCGYEDIEVARRWFIREQLGFVDRGVLRLKEGER